MARFNYITHEIIINEYPDGYLATINRLDEDGDVLYGSTGNYADDPLEAAYDAATYYDESWNDDMILPEELFVEIQEFYEEQIL